jgi:hypothetical protein
VRSTNIVEDYLNSGNARLATAAGAWAAAHGQTLMGIGGMGEHWGTIR